MPEHSVLKPHGILIVTDVDGKTIEADCLRCCHCGKVWKVVPGSGRRRGFCTKCSAPTCGNTDCDPCVPFEQRLDEFEAGKRLIL